MRKWDQKPALIDRRALAMGIAVLCGMALLLLVGLTPDRAQAPGAEDAAQAGTDTAALLGADCQVIQRLTYMPCGHSLTRRQSLPPELAGKGRADLEAVYDLWQITSFSSSEVEMEQALNMFCPQHMVLMPDEGGMLCIWENRYGDALALVQELNLPVGELPDAYQEMLRPGKGFATREELEQWLESVES